jgi:hypothetical protein
MPTIQAAGARQGASSTRYKHKIGNLKSMFFFNYHSYLAPNILINGG